MSVTFTKESDGLLVVAVQGVLKIDDLEEAQKISHKEIVDGGKVRILLLAEEFAGWGKEGDWGDLTFMYEHDPYIEKIAVVAESKWKDQLLMFIGPGGREAEVEFFFEDEVEDARDWLKRESE